MRRIHPTSDLFDILPSTAESLKRRRRAELGRSPSPLKRPSMGSRADGRERRRALGDGGESLEIPEGFVEQPLFLVGGFLPWSAGGGVLLSSQSLQPTNDQEDEKGGEDE